MKNRVFGPPAVRGPGNHQGGQGSLEHRGSGKLNSIEEKKKREQNGAESDRTRWNVGDILVTFKKPNFSFLHF